MIKALSLLMFVIALLFVGGACLLYPEYVRKTNLKLRGTWIRPVPPLMNSGQDIRSIKISGAVAILMGLFFGWVLWINR
jgi:hypothetical protein